MELADKIRAAIDETERIAQDATARGAFSGAWIRDLISCVEDADGRLIVYGEGTPTSAQADHIARQNPTATLRRCAADRKILDLHMPGVALTSVTDGATVTSCTSCGGWYTMKTGTEWPCDTVKALAGAYGIEP